MGGMENQMKNAWSAVSVGWLRVVFTVGLVCMSLPAGGCKGQAKVSDADIKPVNAARVREMLNHHEREPVVLVDVRPAAAFETGHITGALNIPLPGLRGGDRRLAEAEHIVVYGAGWSDVRVPAAVKRLLTLEYEKVYAFRGGYEVWSAGEAVDGLVPGGS